METYEHGTSEFALNAAVSILYITKLLSIDDCADLFSSDIIGCRSLLKNSRESAHCLHHGAVADVGIKDGKVVLLASSDSPKTEAHRTIDAGGKYVVPGGIDAHVHFNLKVSEAMQAQLAAPSS